MLFVLDMLEDFSAAKISSTQTDGPTPSAPPQPASAGGADGSDANLEDLLSDDDFAKKLQAEMAEMMGGMGADVSNASVLPSP